MATISKQAKEIKFMPGSSGNPYFPFARKGNVLLGVRLQGIVGGAYYGVEDATYFMLRLRSAPEAGLFAEEDKSKTVVKLTKNPENLWDAWPGVEWEKKDSSRASTTVGVFERGLFKSKSAETLKQLMAAVGDGKLAEKFTDHLVALAGEENLIVRRSELKKFLDSGFDPVFAKIIESLQQQEKLAELVTDGIGTVMMHVAMIKKVFGDKKKAHDTEVEDVEQPEETEDGEGDAE